MLVGVGRALAWLSPRASRGGHAHTGEAARAPESGLSTCMGRHLELEEGLGGTSYPTTGND